MCSQLWAIERNKREKEDWPSSLSDCEGGIKRALHSELPTTGDTKSTNGRNVEKNNVPKSLSRKNTLDLSESHAPLQRNGPREAS